MITPEGDYLSNLTAPDLRPDFKHLHWRKMPHSMGHLVASDWADKPDDDPVFGLYKNCGLWTRDEAAILYSWAREVGGRWLDIGAHVGWTTRHLIEANVSDAWAVDPLFFAPGCLPRAYENCPHLIPYVGTSNNFFAHLAISERKDIPFQGVVIDGDHEPGMPLQDAQGAVRNLSEAGVILFHDGIGRPVREAVTWLLDQGFKARCYWTPHIVFACWRGDFTPPVHQADPRIDWTAHRAEMWNDFDFGRLS